MDPPIDLKTYFAGEAWFTISVRTKGTLMSASHSKSTKMKKYTWPADYIKMPVFLWILVIAIAQSEIPDMTEFL